MVEFEIERNRLLSLLNAVSVVQQIEDPVINFEENSVLAYNVDKGHFVSNYSRFKRPFFISYNAPETKEQPKKIMFSSETLKEIVTRLIGEIVKVSIDEEKLKLKTDTQKTELELLVPEDRSTRIITPLYEKDEIEMKDIAFNLERKRIQSIEGILGNEELVTLKVEGGTLYCNQMSDKGYLFTTKISEVNSVDFEAHFGTKYLKSVFKSHIGSEMEMDLGKDLPIVLRERNPEYVIINVLAPRIM